MYECRVIRKSLAVRLRRQPRLFHVDGDRGVLCQGALSFIYPGCPYSMQNFLGQGAKPRHSSNLSHSSDNTRSLTFRTSRELSGMLLMTHVSFLKVGGTPALGRLHGSSHVWDRLSCCHKPSPCAGLPQWREWVQKNVCFRAWVSGSFLSAVTYDFGQDPMSFSKVVTCLMAVGRPVFIDVHMGLSCTSQL